MDKVAHNLTEPPIARKPRRLGGMSPEGDRRTVPVPCCRLHLRDWPIQRLDPWSQPH
jgi:hypothetical protein